MSRVKRVYVGQLIHFKKQLKRPFTIVADIMPDGFSDELFVSEFCVCFSSLWRAIIEKHQMYSSKDKGRVKKGLKAIYHFPEAKQFVLWNARGVINRTRRNHARGVIKPDEERTSIRERYFKRSCIKEIARRMIEKKTQDVQQRVEPDFANYFIKIYFDVKHRYPEDVNTRMQILEEVSKYKCAKTISFFFKVNASERNFWLRRYAFLTLQQTFGFSQMKLRPNRKGKKHKGDDIEPVMIDTPEALVSEIYNSQYELERHKEFDVFLSHSSFDRNKLIKLKVLLNSHNLSVYLDWTEDRTALRREVTNADTAKVIMERIKNSQSLMYVLTSASLSSAWASWELGYAHALGKKICVLKVEDVSENPAFLDLYDQVKICGESVVVHSNGVQKPLKVWLAA